MKLLLRRRMILSSSTTPKFSLWAKFDVTEDELRLVQSGDIDEPELL